MRKLGYSGRSLWFVLQLYKVDYTLKTMFTTGNHGKFMLYKNSKPIPLFIKKCFRVSGIVPRFILKSKKVVWDKTQNLKLGGWTLLFLLLQAIARGQNPTPSPAVFPHRVISLS